jgi:hypothetical protein
LREPRPFSFSQRLEVSLSKILENANVEGLISDKPLEPCVFFFKVFCTSGVKQVLELDKLVS